MTSIQILMSTYNGEKYIREQVDSILSQISVEIHILVRDDGSTDKTVDILKEYSDIELIEGENIGSTKSFLELVRVAGIYDYYAFADQDDVWDKDKLSVAIGKLMEYSCPAIYSSNTRYVDSELNLIKYEENRPLTTLGSALVKNYAIGCTTVFNKELIHELKKYKPQNVLYHDWWANILCLSVGGVSIFDYEPHISYRQHDNNVVGGNDSIRKKWLSRLKKFCKKRYHRDIMALEILNNYGDEIGEYEMSILIAMSSGKYTNDMLTGNVLDDFLFKVIYLLKRY